MHNVQSNKKSGQKSNKNVQNFEETLEEMNIREASTPDSAKKDACFRVQTDFVEATQDSVKLSKKLIQKSKKKIKEVTNQTLKSIRESKSQEGKARKDKNSTNVELKNQESLKGKQKKIVSKKNTKVRSSKLSLSY